MRTRITDAALALVLAAGLAPPAAHAQEPAGSAAPAAPEATAAAPADESEPATKGEVKALLEELRRLKLELGLRDVEYQSYGGMGPAASKIYFAPKGLSLGGYGEIYYQNTLNRHTAAGALVPDKSDLYRLVLYTGYRFSPRIVFNAEVEFEHQSEVAVEFAYLDFLLHDAVRIRAGNVLVPLGFVNKMHEPPFFHGVLRPDLETNLIPATWNENGLGLHGELAEGLRYEAYVLNGLNATNGRLTTTGWLRAARTGGGQSPAESLAGVASLAWERGPVSAGGGVYHGRAGQGARDAEGFIDAEVTLAEAHAQLAVRGLQLRGIVAQGWLSDTARLSAFQGGTTPVVLGKRTRGAYVEAAYDVLGLVAPDSGQALYPFVRYEDIDLHHEVADGFTPSPANDYSVVTAGLTYKPLPTVVVKADYSRKETAATSGNATGAVNLGVGFVF